MKDSNIFIILIVIYIVAIIFDMLTKFRICLGNKPQILPLLLFHRILWVFLFFGWIFNNKYIIIVYLVFNITLQIHWLLNSNECILTQFERQICDFPADSYSDYFYDLFKGNISLGYGIVQAIFCSIVIYKLFT